MHTLRTSHKPQQRGVSLIEAMSVVAILSIVCGTALPSFTALRQRADLAGVAAQLETDAQFARSQATAMGHPVRLTLRESAGATCYMVHTGPAAQCECGSAEATASCNGQAELLRSVSLPASGGVPSTTRALAAPSEPAAPGAGSVSVASTPRWRIVPPWRESAATWSARTPRTWLDFAMRDGSCR